MDEVDPYEVEDYSDMELRDRLDELEDMPYLNQARSNEADLIESVLNAREIRREQEQEFQESRPVYRGGVVL